VPTGVGAPATLTDAIARRSDRSRLREIDEHALRSVDR